MSIDPQLLQQFKLYRGLPPESLNALSAIAQHRTVERGEQLWRQGEAAEGYWSLMSGLVKSFREGPDGREQVLCLLGPGQQLGAMAVLSDSSYPCHASVIDGGDALYFPKTPFRNAVREHHELALQLLSGLASQCNVLANRIEDLALRDAEGRVGHYLLHLPVRGSDEEGNAVVHLPVSKTTLSSILGISRETLSRTFATLEERELIAVRGRDIALQNIDGIELLELGRHRAVFNH